MKIDIISELVYGFIRKDKEKIEKAFLVCIANEREGMVKNRFKRMLEEYHRREGMAVIETLEPAVKNMVYAPYRDCSFNDVFLSDEIKAETERFFIEWNNRDVLLDNGLTPTNKILLEGPPGNGKTSYAIAFAKKLGIPLLNTSSSMMLDSHLGKSEQNVSVLFRNIPEKCVLFFDEFEAMAGSRGRASDDSGGAGRAWNSIVTAFLVNMELLRPSVIFMAATNRIELLDKAVLRRFNAQLRFENPTEEEKRAYVRYYLGRYNLIEETFFANGNKINKKLDKAHSYSEIELVLQKRHRELILDNLVKNK